MSDAEPVRAADDCPAPITFRQRWAREIGYAWIGFRVMVLLWIGNACDLYYKYQVSPCTGDCINGRGKYRWPDGSFYVGTFKNGKVHGRGVKTFKKGTYDGEWVNTFMHGQGDLVFKDGERYIGGWKKHRKHGVGTNTWPDGMVYKGGWEDDLMHGKGVLTDHTGKIVREGR